MPLTRTAIQSSLILVTGATGFVGSALVARLAREGAETRACVRRNDASMPDGVHTVQVGDLTADTDWSRALAGVSVVMHAAARAHVMDDTAADPLTEFRRVNVQGTLHLARQAAAAGVRRFVFVSSIKVNGEATHAPHPSPPPSLSQEVRGRNSARMTCLRHLTPTAFPRWKPSRACVRLRLKPAWRWSSSARR